ncbi:stabilizer of axonemal microtubules 1 [Trichosurus vulpecula]|uniref:stabilizer of axonemal microtubules 1 n=1 Tax=Trichosurus vulpecula TaxID=9337 RepID=UPI00186B00C8|nr:stabilizer of axonemal microtubules 1 [Trichosurus vulpecula]
MTFQSLKLSSIHHLASEENINGAITFSAFLFRRHRCPHIPTKIYEQSENKCLLSEYTENYPIHQCYQQRESFKPKLEYQKGSVPMEGLTTARRDYGPHRVFPVKLRPPEQYIPNEENMDLVTTYKQDYNPYPVCRVDPIRPRENKQSCKEKMESLATYKADYLPWNQPKRELIKPDRTYRPAATKFDYRTTHQDDFPFRGLVTTVSCKPHFQQKTCSVPLEDLTNYRLNYVPHPLEKRIPMEASKFKPCDIPFDGITTHKEAFRGLLGEPAKSLKPNPKVSSSESPFANTTEFREKYQVWPIPQMYSRPPVAYIPPDEKMDFLTTAQAHFTYQKGGPAQCCRPVIQPKKSGRFEGSTTNRDDFKQWPTAKQEPIKPIAQLHLPKDPMDCLTTTKTYFVPHPPIITKSCKPFISPARCQVPLMGETTYNISYTPKEPVKCLASYPEPPGYTFDEVDAFGHRVYRPVSHLDQLGLRKNSCLSADRPEGPNQRELAVTA